MMVLVVTAWSGSRNGWAGLLSQAIALNNLKGLCVPIMVFGHVVVMRC